MRREKHRADALERLRQLHERTAARNQDLTDAAARGDVRFERDEH